MKSKIPLIIAILIHSAIHHCYGQSLDSLTQRIIALEVNQKHIQINLGAHERQFTTGTLMMLSGVALTSLHFIVAKEGTDKEPVLAYAGAGLTLIGTAIQIDSHKYFKRASKRKHFKQ